MTASAWATLVAVCGFVWGGALTLVAIAVRKEGRKRGTGSEMPEA
ncbi:MAG: hypothetical protein ACREK5_00875 [Gemmatimonadota bacterium]